MSVPLDAGKPTATHQGSTLPFLLAEMPRQIRRRPGPVFARHTVRQGRAEGHKFTCPMHPEIVRDAREIARNAAWPWSLWAYAEDEGTNPGSWISPASFGSAPFSSVPLLILTMTPYLGYNGIREWFGEQASLD